MNSSFSLKRIGWLARKEFYESFLPHFKIIAIVVSSLVLIRCIIEYFQNEIQPEVVTFDYHGVYLVFGFIYTIGLFGELKLLSTRADYLSLPASTLEKVFTKWFFGNVMYWLGVIIVFTVFFLVQKLIIGYGMGKPTEAFNLFSKDNLTGLHYIIIIFSVYFFGAATFNTGAWYKVITWAVLLSLVYVVIVFLFAYSLFPEMRAELHGSTHINYGEHNAPIELELEDFWVIKFAIFFIQYLAAPFFWFMTYLKIKEKEV